jgi:hypothetical protein
VSRNRLLFLLPLGAAVAALGGVAVLTWPAPRPKAPALQEDAAAAPALAPGTAPAAVGKAEVARPAPLRGGAPARRAPKAIARPRANPRGPVAQAIAPAPEAAVKAAARRPHIRDAFRRKREVAARNLAAEGPRDENSGYDQWFYNQRAFPAGRVPEGALGRALEQAQKHNGGLRGGPGEPAALEGAVPLPTWSALGPSAIPDGQTDTSVGPAAPVSGRLTAIAVHPTNPNIVFAGAAQGGVWRTSNALSSNPTWTPVTDHAASLAIGDIAIDPVNPNIIYAGTGEPNGSCDSYYGQGILRSTDGGATWTLLGKTVPTFPNSGGPFTGKTVSRIYIDPTTAGTTGATRIWASTATGAVSSGTSACIGTSFVPVGLFRSNDSGLTWAQVNVTGASNVSFHDLALDPTNANTLYVAVRGSTANANGGIWKSVNAQATTPAFTRLATGFAVPNTNPQFLRITLAIGGPSAGNVLYASLGSAAQTLFGMYKSTDGGTTWAHVDAGNNGTANVTPGVGTTATVTRVSGPSFTAAMVGRRFIINNTFSRTVASVTDANNMLIDGGAIPAPIPAGTWSVGAFPNYCDNQCFYNMTLAVDPQDPLGNTVYVGGNPRNFNADTSGVPGAHSVWRTLDGGSTWGSVSQGDGVKGGVHTDDHDLAFDTSVVPSRVYDGNDGGIWRSEDQGASWQHMNTNLAITQFQGLALHPMNPSIVLGGTQDNGSNILNPGLQPAPKWYHADFGDGGQALIDQGIPQRMFHTYFNQAFNFMGPAKSLIGGAGGPGSWEFVGTYFGYGPTYYNGMDPRDSVSFYAPIAQHTAFSPNVQYFGSSTLYRSPDPRSVFEGVASWQRLTPGALPPGPAGPPVLVETAAAFLSAIGVLPNLVSGNEVVYTGASDGRIAASNTVNGTSLPTWLILTPVAGGPVIPNRFVTEIEVARTDLTGNTAYVTFSGFNGNTPTQPGHVFKTTNGLGGSATWINVSGDLPDVPTNSIAIDYLTSPPTLYVGTDIGVFRSQNDGVNWVYLSAGHPVVSVFGLDRSPTTGQLVSATHGRGMFQLGTGVVVDSLPPTCGGSVSGTTYNGTANDDVGIASIQLGPGSSNLTIVGLEYAGPQAATFRVVPTSGTCGAGTIVVTDQGGNTCSAEVNINAPARPNGFSNSPVRAGTTLQLNATDIPGATWSWTGPSGFSASVRNPSIPDVTEANEGTYFVRYTLASCPSVADDVSVVVVPATNDFNFDGHMDLVWRHDVSGENVVWFMDGATLLSGVFTTPSVLADTRWKIGGTNDFNGDGKTDLLWRHDTAGQNVVWFMNGTTLASGTFTNPPALADVRWKIAGSGDFDQDGKPDIAWHHVESGEIVLWYLNGVDLTSGTFTTPSSLPDTRWRLVGVGDFNRDTRPDFLWRHEVTGDLVTWFMANSVLVSGNVTVPAGLSDTSWRVYAVADFDQNGVPDIVYRHGGSGQNVIWFMDFNPDENRVELMRGTFTTPLPDTSWKIVGPR